jgi:hypothetical protein
MAFRFNVSAENGDDEDEEGDPDEDAAEGKADPEQEDLNAMGQRRGAGSLREEAEGTTTGAEPDWRPQQDQPQQKSRGPSREVRDRVYRRLERQAHRTGLPFTTPETAGSQGPGPTQQVLSTQQVLRY